MSPTPEPRRQFIQSFENRWLNTEYYDLTVSIQSENDDTHHSIVLALVPRTEGIASLAYETGVKGALEEAERRALIAALTITELMTSPTLPLITQGAIETAIKARL